MVLYFYPKDGTSGRTAEACGFRDAQPKFIGCGCIVIGVSRDSRQSHDKFKKKHSLVVTLGVDENGQVTEDFGTWVEKSMFGVKYMGIERATFLIDGKGIIRGMWRKVKVPSHVEKVLAAAKALRSPRQPCARQRSPSWKPPMQTEKGSVQFSSFLFGKG